MKRASGILLPISSLPSKYGIGSFSKSAYEFVDWLKNAGQKYWQILPLGITGYGDSPYQSFSTFAGNPYYISLEEFIDEGIITKEECDASDFGENAGMVDYHKLYTNRYKLLKKAFDRSNHNQNDDYNNFLEENKHWLGDYCVYMSVKNKYNGNAFTMWPDEYKFRKEDTLAKCIHELSEDISFHRFLQYMFFKQWNRLKKYANDNGIKIIGDIPIYVAHDSVDVWTNPKQFHLDDNLMPVCVAGCPPDGFSEDGQLWGNPLYNWSYHKETDYDWWRKRLEFSLKIYDVLRIDHFRGFESYYSIPYGEKTAINGKWNKGPGYDLFLSLSDITDNDKIIAEDLGYMTDAVKELLKKCGFPGMKVIQFAFDSRDSGVNEHLPHLYTNNSVVYTGTHDNQTTASWYKTISEKEREFVRKYISNYTISYDKIYKSLISLALRSVSDLSIIPLQDWLGLDDSARINTPSTSGNNWRWRLDSIPDNSIAKEIKEITSVFGRL